MPPLSHPKNFPSAVPGGSLIGSIGSQLSTAYTQTLHAKTQHSSQYDPRSPPPTYTSQKPENSPRNKARPASCFLQGERRQGVPLERVVQNLSRDRVASLAIQARMKQIPDESEEELRRIVVGAVNDGILKPHDIQTTCTNSFMALPTDIQLRITSYLPLRTLITFLARINTNLIHLAHYPQLWIHLSLSTVPSQSTLLPLSRFLLKYTPAKSIKSLCYASTTTPPEFLKFALTLKTLHSRLEMLHLHGKRVTNLVLAAAQSLLGKWTREICLEGVAGVDVAQLSALIATAPKMRVLSLEGRWERTGGFKEVWGAMMTAGAVNRLHHRHPEINTHLRTLHLSSSSLQSVSYSHLASLGSFFPHLKFLRVENCRVTNVRPDQGVVTIKSLHGLALVALDIEKGESFTGILTRLIPAFPALEILMLGTRDMPNLWGWKLFNRKRELGRMFFETVSLANLRVLWLRGFTFDAAAFLKFHVGLLQFVVLEGCRGSNGGWVKGCRNKWPGVIVVESPVKMKDGVDFVGQRKRQERIVRMAEGLGNRKERVHA